MSTLNKLATIIISLSTTSCSIVKDNFRSFAGATAGLVIGAGLYKVSSDNKREKENQSSEVIQDIDTSGTILQLGGMLVNDYQFLHVSHWPYQYNQVVNLKTKDGETITRHLINKEDLGSDLSLLTLDKPIDLNDHTILPIAKAKLNTPTTAFRLYRNPVGTYISGRDDKDRVKLNLPKNNRHERGDSGKMSVQVHNGKHVVVTFNSTANGWGPDIHTIWNRYLNQTNK